ncbi:MAG TPA: damage-inducible protein CinA, partial [Succinivibrio sp.]|nr:damage-inducible protein CinA [Succinivibrio sp.]
LTKPVGTVWMAVQRRGEESRATLLQLHGSRDEIRLQTTLHALKALIETTVA